MQSPTNTISKDTTFGFRFVTGVDVKAVSDFDSVGLLVVNPEDEMVVVIGLVFVTDAPIVAVLFVCEVVDTGVDVVVVRFVSVIYVVGVPIVDPSLLVVLTVSIVAAGAVDLVTSVMFFGFGEVGVGVIVVVDVAVEAVDGGVAVVDLDVVTVIWVNVIGDVVGTIAVVVLVVVVVGVVVVVLVTVVVVVGAASVEVYTFGFASLHGST